jgi:transposase
MRGGKRKVLNMARVNYIRDLWESEGLSLREISRRTGYCFRTVQKYAYREDYREKEPPSKKEKRSKVMGPYMGAVDVWMDQDQKEPRKQRHTAKRIWERLVDEHGFGGSYSTVKKYVAKERMRRQREKGGYLPLSQPAGEAQADFGKFKYYDASGKEQAGYALVVSFPYSNAAWMQVFQGQNQECLIEGLMRVFRHIGGVAPRLILDNLSAAVAEIGEGRERKLTDGFLRFKAHYRFEAEFCNPYAANEKGNVENKVGYSRRNLLVPVPTITDFEAYNVGLMERCDADHQREHYLRGATIAELWEEERAALISLPAYPYEAFRYLGLHVSKTGFVTIDTNRYGLAPEMAGRMVQAKVYYERVELYYERELLKSYPRSYRRQEEISDWRLYLSHLKHKPGGIEHTRFFGQMPKLWQGYLRSSQGKERRSALALLKEIVKDGNEHLCDEALALASQSLAGQADSDSIRQCYLYLCKPGNYPAPLTLASEPPKINYTPDLSAYDALYSPRGRPQQAVPARGLPGAPGGAVGQPVLPLGGEE